MPLQYSQNPQYLSNEEFESLKRVVQLLRISQLRYIVQKFSIPASGNKTKLLSLLLSIFHSLRYDHVLMDIYHEINNIISKKEVNSIKQLEIITHFDSNFKQPQNPLLIQSDPPFMLGPILVPSGQSSGQFGFMYSDVCDDLTTSINICFLFPGGKIQQFTLKGEINGFPLEVSIDDPYPQPIDITEYINIKTIMNTFNIKLIKTSDPMMICIREYKYCGLQNLMDQIVGRAVDLDNEDFDVLPINCQHKETFSLSSFLSNSLGTGNWNCPICNQPVDVYNLKVTALRDISKDFNKTKIQFSPFDSLDVPEYLSSIISPSDEFTPANSNSSLSINNIKSESLSKLITEKNTKNNISNTFKTESIENFDQNHSQIQNIQKDSMNYKFKDDNSSENNNSNTSDIFKASDILDSFGWDQI